LYLFTEPPKGQWVNDSIIITSVLLWVFATSIAGGYVSSKYSEKKEDFSTLLFIVFSFMILLLVYGLDFLNEWIAAIPVGAFIIGACAGNVIWRRKKNKAINSSSSPAAPQ
jgi:CHASE2 domain-containing sensor protein